LYNVKTDDIVSLFIRGEMGEKIISRLRKRGKGNEQVEAYGFKLHHCLMSNLINHAGISLSGSS
jgi:hypothetical protein